MLRKLIVCCTDCAIALTVLSGVSLYAPTASAEAPVNTFLAELKDRRLFDVALRHVERMATSPLTSAEFKQEVDYVRGELLVDAARASKGTNGVQQQLNQAEAAFAKFLRAQPNHPSATLARSQLGNILVERARRQLAAAERDKTNQAELLKQAGQTYAKAYKSLTQSRTEIGKQIKSLTAQRDGDTKRLISDLRTKYVQTYLAVARVLFEQAKTVKGNPTKYKTKLEAAAKEFGEVVDKYRAYSASILALRYQGECYQLMGEHKQALSYYKELLQSDDNSPPVRRLKTQALAKSIDSLLITERNSGPDRAIRQATGWMRKKRPGEDRDATWQELQLALARAYKQKADITEDDTQSARTIREARELANQVAKRRGPHQTDAQRLLVSLGGNTTTKEAAIVDGAKAANFAEARDAAMSSLDALKRANVTVKILSEQLGSVADVGRRAAFEEKLAEATEQSETLSVETLERFEQADALATKDDLDAQNGVRYYLAFLNYSAKQYRRAAVIGSYVALRFPDSIAAKECANVALAARQRLYQQSDPESREAQGQEIARLAELMVSRWPNQAAGDSALMTLLDVVVSRGDLQGAQAYLEKIPADSPKRATAELRIGQAIWRKYLTSVAGGDTTKDAEELRTQAQQILASGIGRLGSDARDESTVRAALSLAQIYVDSGSPKLALDLLTRDGFGALKLIESNSAITKRIPVLATEAYKTAIRAHVATAATSGDTAGSIRSAQKMLEALQDELKKQPNGKQKIVAIYISLAKDLERQLTIAAPGDRKALSRGFETFLRGASDGNKDIAVQNWAGATFFSLGQGMLQGNKTSPEAQRYFTESAKAYAQVLMMAKAQPKAMSASALMQVRARQAMALRQLGDYSKSIDLFADVLGGQKKSYLNIQIEAARTFQQWGIVGGNSKALTKAINGDKPRGDGRNVIWGWGRIAKLVAKNEQYRDTFHEARYNIALCRYRFGLSLSGSKKTQTLKRAKSDITFTKQLYRLGKKSQERRYEDLLKKIQRALNENPVGFGETEST